MTRYKINQQAPGPFRAERGACRSQDVVQACDDPRHVATVHEHGDGESVPTARLLATAYTAFDRAGRELGVGAVELAETLDIVGMIRALTECKEVIRNFRGDRLPIREPWVNETFDAACAVLAKVPKPEPHNG